MCIYPINKYSFSMNSFAVFILWLLSYDLHIYCIRRYVDYFNHLWSLKGRFETVSQFLVIKAIAFSFIIWCIVVDHHLFNIFHPLFVIYWLKKLVARRTYFFTQFNAFLSDMIFILYACLSWRYISELFVQRYSKHLVFLLSVLLFWVR